LEVAVPTRQVVGLEPGQCAADGGPFRLLVAEDQEANRRLLIKLLGELGSSPPCFEVREAKNGREAIEIWEQWDPHLIWMDLRMPVLDGYEAIKRIKAADKGQGTILIALTASAFEEDRERVLAEGCDDFVRKPFLKDEIYAVLAEHLGVRFVYQESGDQRSGERLQPARQSDRTSGVGGKRASAEDALSLSLSAMPAEWLAGLRRATTRANSRQILALVDQVRDQDPALAELLAEWVHNFEYRKILTLIEQAGGQR
jgi:CheY-like chemotaxis protein